MTETPYSFSVRVRAPYAEVEATVREALKSEGFGVLTEIDAAAAFREKLGREFRRYKILGACNPRLAYEALTADLELGTLLPCNVVLYEDGSSTVVSAMDPRVVLSLVGNPAIERVARDVRARLERVLNEVGRKAGAAGSEEGGESGGH